MEVMMDIDDQVLIIWKRRKRKIKMGSRKKVYVIGSFLFCTQDKVEGVSDLGSIAVLLRGKILS
jgi:hypothetical protein